MRTIYNKKQAFDAHTYIHTLLADGNVKIYVISLQNS